MGITLLDKRTSDKGNYRWWREEEKRTEEIIQEINGRLILLGEEFISGVFSLSNSLRTAARKQL